jgi:hypothetical protein
VASFANLERCSLAGHLKTNTAEIAPVTLVVAQRAEHFPTTTGYSRASRTRSSPGLRRLVACKSYHGRSPTSYVLRARSRVHEYDPMTTLAQCSLPWSIVLHHRPENLLEQNSGCRALALFELENKFPRSMLELLLCVSRVWLL